MVYSDIIIENFRGIRTCTLKDLGQVNLFFGKNNCGKSSLLESIFLLSGPSNPALPVSLNNIRRFNHFNEEDLKVDFYQTDTSNTIRFQSFGSSERDVKINMIESHANQVALDKINHTGSDQVGKRFGFKISFLTDKKERIYHSELIVSEDNKGKVIKDPIYRENLFAKYITSGYIQSDNMGNLAEILKNKDESKILEALRILEPNIKDIILVGDTVMVDVGMSTRLPINVLGDGVRKVLSIIISVYETSNGVLLIDEIENGLHYSVMVKLWNVILNTCKKTNTQLFISTHSLDIVKALVESLREQGADAPPVSSYKLVRKDDDELVALRYGEEQLAYAVEQEIEVR